MATASIASGLLPGNAADPGNHRSPFLGWLLLAAGLAAALSCAVHGQQFRVTCRLLAESSDEPIVFDEYTSVVDRTVAQIGSAAVARVIRQAKSNSSPSPVTKTSNHGSNPTGFTGQQSRPLHGGRFGAGQPSTSSSAVARTRRGHCLHAITI